MVSERGVITYPIPLYANLPIRADFYQPRRFVIAGITLGQTTTITTTADHDYVIGQTIRLLIPPSYGSYQLNEVQGYVLSIPTSTSVITSINSLRNVDAFIASTNRIESAQILAIGDINSGATNSSGRINNLTYIEGSFINISPE